MGSREGRRFGCRFDLPTGVHIFRVLAPKPKARESDPAWPMAQSKTLLCRFIAGLKLRI